MEMQTDHDYFMKAFIVGESTFLHPKIKYDYDQIIDGVIIEGKKQKAVDVNTTQAFGRKFRNGGNFYDNKLKAMEVFDRYFKEQRFFVISRIRDVHKKSDLDILEQDIYKALFNILKTAEVKLDSYNRIRKIINLYIEHIVAMANEIDDDTRATMTPLLFLPIDSKIIGNEKIINTYYREKWGLKSNSGFGDIKDKRTFDEIQEYIVNLSLSISAMLNKAFCPIYFDVFWGKRLNSSGINLFYANLGL
jgi:hypothetical protein